MSTKEKIISLIAISFFLFMWYNIDKAKKEIKNNIVENQYVTVCKVFSVDTRRSFTHANYYYYYDGLKYESTESVSKFEYEILNRYYKVELSTENPKYSKILFDQEVTDSTEIVKAGFTLGEPKEPLVIPPHNTEVSTQR